MGKRIEPIRKKPGEILDDLRAGTADAALSGAKAAQKFLERTLEAQGSLPNGVKFFAADLLAGHAREAGDDEACEGAVRDALERWADAEEQFPRELATAKASLKFVEAGIAVRAERGDVDGAIELCDFAIGHGLGRHYEAKRERLLRMR